jgi:hypothetical protein
MRINGCAVRCAIAQAATPFPLQLMSMYLPDLARIALGDSVLRAKFAQIICFAGRT